MHPLLFLLTLALAPLVASQTVTHITQVNIFSDLAPCAQAANSLLFANQITAQCPQKAPLSAASCMCLKSGNVEQYSSSAVIWIAIWCSANAKEDLSSGMAVYSQYCSQALKGGSFVTTTSGGNGDENAANTDLLGGGSITGFPTPSSTGGASTPSSTQNNESQGLSRSDKIGLGVGVPAAVAAVTAILATLYKLWKSRKQQKETAAAAPPPTNLLWGPQQQYRPQQYQPPPVRNVRMG